MAFSPRRGLKAIRGQAQRLTLASARTLASALAKVKPKRKKVNKKVNKNILWVYHGIEYTPLY